MFVLDLFLVYKKQFSIFALKLFEISTVISLSIFLSINVTFFLLILKRIFPYIVTYFRLVTKLT